MPSAYSFLTRCSGDCPVCHSQPTCQSTPIRAAKQTERAAMHWDSSLTSDKIINNLSRFPNRLLYLSMYGYSIWRDHLIIWSNDLMLNVVQTFSITTTLGFPKIIFSIRNLLLTKLSITVYCASSIKKVCSFFCQNICNTWSEWLIKHQPGVKHCSTRWRSQ